MRDFFGRASTFASRVTVYENGTEREARAFIEPINPTSPEYTYRPTPMGMEDDRRYLIIAEPDAFYGTGEAEIRCGERTYQLLRCELMGGGSHWEGIMRLKGEGENVF